MKRLIAVCGMLVAVAGAALCEDAVEQDRWFLPHNWVRGYVDFEVAPPHNEIDLGMCVAPGCTAYARYAWSGYVEAQPIGRGTMRRLFLFTEPKLYGGNNLPQVRYTGSASLIAWERAAGVGWVLPRGVELRLTQHQTFLLGRFSGREAGVRPDGPYGLNMRIGVRWAFGGWGGASARSH
jgi:hypothetical protein